MEYCFYLACPTEYKECPLTSLTKGAGFNIEVRTKDHKQRGDLTFCARRFISDMLLTIFVRASQTQSGFLEDPRFRRRLYQFIMQAGEVQTQPVYKAEVLDAYQSLIEDFGVKDDNSLTSKLLSATWRTLQRISPAKINSYNTMAIDFSQIRTIIGEKAWDAFSQDLEIRIRAELSGEEDPLKEYGYLDYTQL